MRNKIAVIAYTTFSTDTRVQKEAYAALEAGYELDIYTLEDKHVADYSSFNFIRSNIVQYKGQSKFEYIFSYIKFFFYCLFFLTFRVFSNKYKFIHVHNMPNFLVFSTLIPKIFGAKIILDIHDLMPEIFSVKFKLPLNHWLIKMMYFEERVSANFVNEIISTNGFHTKRFNDNGIKNVRITEVINVADEQIFYPPNSKEYTSSELFIAYPSTLAKRLGIDDLLDAVEYLNNKGLKIRLSIYGDGEYREDISKRIINKNLESIVNLSDTFVGLQTLSKELDSAHIGVIPLPSNVSNDIAMPVKIYEYFAKKICVVATDLPLMKSCFNNSVVFYQQGNSADLSATIERLYNDRSLIKEYAEKGYNKFSTQTWNYYKAKYISILNNTI